MTGAVGTEPLDRLLSAVSAGQPRSVARLLSLVEAAAPSLPAVMAALAPRTGRAWVIGLTGAPGVGKSTTTTALVAACRSRGQRVGVLAVDPSSPFSGGALLGDRVRMQEHALDPEVFIRSMAARGHLGGVAAAAPQALRVFDAAGCDTVVVETVGVGQSEIEIAGLADVTVVVVAPGMGDAIQAAKAGILEVGDVFVVNKADRDGTQPLIRDLRTMIALGDRKPTDWKPPIVATVAVRGEGIAELVDALARHREHAQASGSGAERRRQRAEREIEALALERWRAGWRRQGHPSRVLAERVRDGELDPYAAAEELLAAWQQQESGPMG